MNLHLADGRLSRQPSGKLDNIQTLRALAATMVIVDHAIICRGPVAPGTEQLAWQMGNVGVWTFFVISGFIMYYSEGRNFGTSWAPLRFAWKRLARIVPLYWIATAVAIALSLLAAAKGHSLPPHSVASLHNVLLSMLFLPYVSTSGDRLLPILGPGWTLEYEMIFYVLFGVSMLLPKALGKKVLLLALFCIVVVGAFIRPLGEKSDAHSVPAFVSDPVLILFVAGIALAAFRQKLEFAASSSYLFLLVLLLSLPCIMFYDAGFYYPLSSLEKLVFWLPCVFAVILCIYTKPPRGMIGQFCVLMGDASYATYLCNLTLVSSLSKVFTKLQIHLNLWLYLVLLVLGANICGVVLHLFLERPLLKALGRPAMLFSRAPSTP